MTAKPFRWLKPPVFPDETRTERAVLLHVISIVVFFAATVLLMFQWDGRYFPPTSESLTLNWLVLGASVAVHVMNRRGWVMTAAIVLIAMVWTSTTLRFLFAATLRSHLLFNYAILIIFAGLILGRKAVWVLFAAALIPPTVHLWTAEAQIALPVLFFGSPESALWEYLVALTLATSLFWYALGRIEQNFRALRESESRNRALISAIPDLIFLNDRDGTFIDVKSHDVSRLLIPPEAFLGKKPHQVLPPMLADRFSSAFRAALTDGREQVLEYDLRMPDGVHHYESRVVPCTDASVMTVARDITRRKRTQEEIERLNADLERRVKERTAELLAVNQELESFVYTISHDLRAPLRGVGGFAALLQRDHSGHLGAEGLGYLQRIADGTRRMGALIDDLLSFAHISRKDVRRERIRPSEVLRQVIEELQPAIRSARTEIVIGDLPEISADPALLRQVFANLLSNAIKYSSKVAAPRVDVRSELSNGTAVFTVSDNGVGFDMKYAHKLFGVFQRLHAMDEFEGTGVGLAIVHRIVTRHGGEIRVDAAEGRGATFSFTLEPAAERSATSS